jgi:hypothetical protein
MGIQQVLLQIALEDIKHQDTHRSVDASIRFGAQELGIGEISTKVVE